MGQREKKHGRNVSRLCSLAVPCSKVPIGLELQHQSCCSECFASAESSPQGCQCKCDVECGCSHWFDCSEGWDLIHKCSKVMVQAIIPGLSNKTRERDKYLKTLRSGLCIRVLVLAEPSALLGVYRLMPPFLAVSLGGLKSDDGKECLLRWILGHLPASTLGDATVDHFDKL